MKAESSPAAARVAEAELHEHVAEAFLNPNRAAGLPRVLLIGDSISIGYTEPVRRKLKEVAEVFRPPENCQHTGHGLAQMGAWLGAGKWGAIHFNFGIWDTHLLDARGNLVRADDDSASVPGIRIRHTPEQYRANLAHIVALLKNTGARLIWASTTPIMSRTGARFEAIPALNRVAAGLMQAEHIPIDDLYQYVLPHVREWQDPDQCHFNALGNRQLGKQVADCIRRILAGLESMH